MEPCSAVNTSNSTLKVTKLLDQWQQNLFTCEKCGDWPEQRGAVSHNAHCKWPTMFETYRDFTLCNLILPIIVSPGMFFIA
jgi:hypothetical protein